MRLRIDVRVSGHAALRSALCDTAVGKRRVSSRLRRGWKDAARALKRETCALYFACRDPRVPVVAKVLAAVVVAYAFSPIDLIPDFIPVLGHLDDLILIPLGVLLVRALIPESVLEECRQRALALEGKPVNRAGAMAVVLVWLALALAAAYWGIERFAPCRPLLHKPQRA